LKKQLADQAKKLKSLEEKNAQFKDLNKKYKNLVVKHEQLSIQKQGVDEEIQKLQFNIGAQPEKPEPVAAEQVPAPPDLDFQLKALATLINHGKLDENLPLRGFCEETLNKFHAETGGDEDGSVFETFKKELTDRCTTYEEF